MDSRSKGRSFVRRMRVLPVLVLVLSGLAPLQGAPVLAQNNSPHFNVDPHSENVWGHEWTPNDTVQVSINDELVAEPLTDAFGNFDTGFDPAVRDIVPGDHVQVTDGSVTKGLSVTGIAITDVDVDNDTVSGIADGDHVDVWVDESDVWRREVVTGGTWTANFGVPGTEGGEEAIIDLTPGMHGGSNECDDDGDCTFAHWQSGERPHIHVNPLNDNILGGFWLPDTTLEITIDDPLTSEEPDHTVSWDTWGDGAFDFNLWDEFGIDVGHDDVVTTADYNSVADMIVVPVEVTSVDIDAATASGTSRPDEVIWVQVLMEDADVWRYTTANGAGIWSVDFTIQGTEDEDRVKVVLDHFEPGWTIRAHRYDFTNVPGAESNDNDASIHDWRIPNPHFNVDPHSEDVWGHEWPANDAVQVFINGALVAEPFTDAFGNFGTGFDPAVRDIVPIDHVQVTDGSVTKDLFVTGIAVTDVDVDNDTVSGVADGDHVDVWVDESDVWRREVVTGGTWTANFGDAGDEGGEEAIINLTPGMHGGSNECDDDGDCTFAHWRTPNPTFSVEPPFDVWSTGEDWVEGTTVTVNIDDPSNGPGADYTDLTVVERWGPNPWDVGFNFHTEPFEIHPGFVVTVDDDSTVKTLEVVDITVETVDEVADTVSGYAPPGERVEVHAGDEFSHPHRSVDADANTGYWMANFSVPGEEVHEQEILDIQPWVGGAAEVPDEDGDSTHQGWCFECEGPVVTNVLADPNPAAVNTVITVSANVDDTGTGNSNIADAEYSLNGAAWADMAPSDMSFDSPTEDVEAMLSGFSEAGVHETCVRGTDAAGNPSSGEDCTLLAVYDPSAGFVTGGGWIMSPEGAYVADPSLTGKANFGFVSKYKKGASVPTGNTEFQFKAGGLNFHSSSYDWLVVNQGGANAQYKGVGTINGAGAYKFMLWATDGDNKNPPEDDTFRIKIWYEDGNSEIVVYDNGFDQAIGGGNIKVHDGK